MLPDTDKVAIDRCAAQTDPAFCMKIKYHRFIGLIIPFHQTLLLGGKDGTLHYRDSPSPRVWGLGDLGTGQALVNSLRLVLEIVNSGTKPNLSIFCQNLIASIILVDRLLIRIIR